MNTLLPFYKLEQYIPQAAGAILLESGSFSYVVSSSIDKEDIQTPMALIKVEVGEQRYEQTTDFETWNTRCIVMILTNRLTNSETSHFDYIAKTRYLLENNFKWNDKLEYHLVSNIRESNTQYSIMEDDELLDTTITFDMDISMEPTKWMAANT